MKKIFFFCFLSTLLLLMRCGKSTESEQGPLFSVKVVDTTGLAVPDLRVGSINHSAYLDYTGKASPAPMACPTTGISFALPASGHVTLRILNYYGG